MNDNRTSPPGSLIVRKGQALVSIPDEENGEQITRVYVKDSHTDTQANDWVLHKALAAIGSWSDLDWEETVEALDRIRHDSKPTPPIDLDEDL